MEYDGRRPRIPKVLGERIDRARGQVPFDRWVRSVLEAALDGSPLSAPAKGSAARGVGPEKAPRSPDVVPASPRAQALDPALERQRKLNEAKYGRS